MMSIVYEKCCEQGAWYYGRRGNKRKKSKVMLYQGAMKTTVDL